MPLQPGWKIDAHGYDAVTMEQIAAQADVAKRTLYNHFPTKEAVLAHWLEGELAPRARDTLATARQAFAAAQATLGQEGASASSVHRAVTQFTRTSSALRALAGDLEHHTEWLLPGSAGEPQPADAARTASEAR